MATLPEELLYMYKRGEKKAGKEKVGTVYVKLSSMAQVQNLKRRKETLTVCRQIGRKQKQNETSYLFLLSHFQGLHIQNLKRRQETMSMTVCRQIGRQQK